MAINLKAFKIGQRLRYLTLLILIFPGLGNAMSSFNPLKACIFSDMHINLTLDGKPASGAKVVRTVNWKNEITDTFTADEAGQVDLPAMYQSSITQALPVEFVSAQVIKVQYEDEEYKIWVYAKRDPAENVEFDGRPIQLTCELSEEPTTSRAFGSVVKTACKWNS